MSGQNQEAKFQLTSVDLSLRRKIRHLTDRSAKVAIAVGGIGVIITILLIFLYLIYEIVPLFRSAEVSESASYSLQAASGNTLHLAIEEQSEIGLRLADNGSLRFFRLADGNPVDSMQLPIPADTTVSAFGLESEESGIFALGLDNGSALIAQYEFETRFEPPDNRRVIVPRLSYPFGEEAVILFPDNPVAAIAIRTRGDSMMLSGVADDGSLALVRGEQQTGLFAAFDFGDAPTVDLQAVEINLRAPNTRSVFIEGDSRWLYLIANNGLLRMLDIQAAQQGNLDDYSFETYLGDNRQRLTQVSQLLGGISLLTADTSGVVGQWVITRDGDLFELSRIRAFEGHGEAINALTVEQRRKNFIAADANGRISFYNTTASRSAFSEVLVNGAISKLAISPRGDALLAETMDGGLSTWHVENEHPEVSWAALWNEVWYEGYSQSEYIWQSSGATNEFEPKYSLMPLSFGTIKAAFYAMLLAAPLSICGAIFTGYFMAPAMRRNVKPLIELMAALPTVVLGFLAGLWLAPFLENNLLSIISMLIVLPVSIVAASLGWMYLPKDIRHRIPDGWEAALLVPVILLFGYLSFLFATPLEVWLFDGDLRFWITNDLGISYDQRNAMVVGFAMGFAVIPTIFSIAEDAISEVPRSLSYGSLALGATPWQTLYRVILPTASPGIFSALMIGMGRAVGETMIVLMATGNTPIMDMNIFEGMRTLAANIAVEIPESEVDSTHYRILFLAALVLFIFTFVINTVAEVIRQRLRSKYSTI